MPVLFRFETEDFSFLSKVSLAMENPPITLQKYFKLYPFHL